MFIFRSNDTDRLVVKMIDNCTKLYYEGMKKLRPSTAKVNRSTVRRTKEIQNSYQIAKSKILNDDISFYSIKNSDLTLVNFLLLLLNIKICLESG